LATSETKGKILIIEDEFNFARYVQLELLNEGYSVEVANDGLSGLQKALENDYDVIILDVMLPELSGMEVCRRIRQVKETPILMLTARSEVPDKVAGLDSGANDYLTKPFAIEELFARIRVHLRQKHKNDLVEIQINTLVIQPRARRVFREGKEIELTAREFDLLLYLVQHQGHVLSRDQLLTAVWGFDFTGTTNVVDVYILYLRQKVEPEGATKLIHTIRGIGYTLRA
jgi:DNA-binding response OmpR family regulator